jgi:LDH2 family malate/lactate/ureidoglycolate dehydrogenase
MNRRYFQAEDLASFATQVVTRAGLPPADAEHVGRSLVRADLRGVDSHGVTRIPIYVERLRRDLVNKRPNIRIDVTGAGVAVVDGDNGMGAVVGRRAMEAAIALAKDAGTGAVAVRGSNHFGTGAGYAYQAVEARCIGVACSNAPPTMAPWGGRVRYFGTNPLAVGIPAGRYPPIVLDMATSNVARGKVILAAKRGEPIPEGWALDPEGRPTTDAEAALAGAVLPFGGPKGSAIALIIDVLSGVLSGANFSRHIPDLYDNLEERQDLGHFFLAVEIERFMRYDTFTARVDQMIEGLKECPPAAGHAEVLLPGEIEARTEVERQLRGIPVTGEIIDRLVAVGKELGVAFPEGSPGPLQ